VSVIALHDHILAVEGVHAIIERSQAIHCDPPLHSHYE
jgi:hypothetical protein